MWSNNSSPRSTYSPKATPSPTFAPLRRSSTSSTDGVRQLTTSHYRTPSKTLSAFLLHLKRAASTRTRPRRLVSWFLALWALAYLLVLPGRRVRVDFGDRIRTYRCRYLPSRGDCSLDPFAKLAFDVKGGHMYYPGRVRRKGGRDEEHLVVGNFEDDSPFHVGPVSDDSAEYPIQPHPIHLLLRTAEEEWHARVARQSTSLKEACTEYRRRYNRAPPKGFDSWYNFSKRNDVPLVDEYDAINHRILPLFSLPPHVIKQRSEMLQHDETFWMRQMTATMLIRDGGKDIKVEGPMAEFNKRPAQVLKLLDGISQYLPDLNVTFTGHDNPWITVSGEAMARHIAAAKAGKYIPDDELENYHDNGALEGWAAICPPSSPLTKAPKFDQRKDWKPPRRQSFIVDHLEAMDVCNHPEWQPLHGTTSWPGPRPGLLFPMFTFTTDVLHWDMMLPPLEQWDAPVGDDPDWNDKEFNKVVWRGSTTGSDLTLEQARKWSQRPRLCKLNKQSGHVKVQLSLNDQPGKPGPATPYAENARDLAEEYFDFHFMGYPKQCGDEKSCAEFEAQFEWDTHMPYAEQNEYKYVIDVDGNGWSGRFHRLMSSNNMVLKSTIFPEWYSERIQPWYHYVPISTDYQDLWNVMAFFKGDLHGNGAHDAEAEKIGKQGQKWANETWRWVDMQCYMLRMLLEYARLMLRDDANPRSMDFDDSNL